MEAFGLLVYGFSVLLTWKILALMMVGLVLGIFVGVLPGLGGPNGVAILLPLTFTMDPTSAIVMLSCIYWGALFGGAITSILFNIPGEAWSVATTFDGYPMAQQGQAAEALTAAFTSSFVGSLVAVLLITFLAPGIASFALKFGPPEFFAVYLLTFCSFVGLGREDKHKTVISMALGLLIAGIGMDTVSGQLRMTFGSNELLRGVNFLVAGNGLFRIRGNLLPMEGRPALRGHAARVSLPVVLKVWKEMPRYWVTLLRSSFIGCWLGITPGGAIAASFMGYNMAKRLSKDPDSFGKGRIEGVFAPETAAHASGTSALLPMLALGIPGSGTAAILLGGLMVWGLNPGPLLFVEHKDFVWGLIASMYLGNVVGLVLVLTTVPIFASILRVPFAAVAPMIVVSCAIGAYAIQNAMFDNWLMLGFGVVGYVFTKIAISRAPFTPVLVAVESGRRFLQIPGPANVPDRVLRAMDRPTMDHRGPEFAEIGHAVLAAMQRVFRTKQPVIIYPSSGTGAWEAALVNTLQPGDKVLMAETGQFAVLWRGIAEKFKIDVDFLPGDWRHGADLEQIEARLSADKAPKIKAVCVVHNETSTGCVTHPQDVRKILDRVNHPALLMVDTISGLGSLEYEHDAWGIDVSVAGSQKGLMLPPGLGFNAISEKALAVAKANPAMRSYWDWQEVIAINNAGTWPYTPATNLLFGLREAVKMLEEEGLENVFARHNRHSAATRAAAKVWGL